MNQLTQSIFEPLKQDDSLWNEDKTELNKTLLLDRVEHYDEKIIDLLLQNKKLKKNFFIKVKDVFVFKSNDFKFFLEKNQVDHSYTAYKNRIGLTDGKRFIKDTNDVVLDFPYKDCVLEGGQSSEEGNDSYFEYSNKSKTGKYEQKQSKRKEIFYNQILAHDEIDRLFDLKSLTNWKRHTQKGEEKVKKIKRDEDGTIGENMIIKGNNLLVLHSLKKQFAGKVKLIYIDPPYNTGNDGFKYNDSFNHSTWLTFMKNRLEVARELLRDDGAIFISCDDNEQAYLKVLMDEVFGRENFIVNFVWETKKGAQGIVTKHMIVSNHETITVFAKNHEHFTCRGLERDEKEFMNPDNDPRGKWKRQYLQRFGHNFPERTIVDPQTGDSYTFETPYTQDKLEKWIEEKTIIFPKKTHQYPARKEFLKDYKNKKQLVSSLGLFPTKSHTEGLYKLFKGKKIFRNPKPEPLIQFLIEQSTSPIDIVLDFHLGSGTTCAVAHKMGRQYIGIEQMDYVEEVAVERLKKVIDGEQGGISKAVKWKGGGDFLYFELAQWNETAKKKIIECQTLKELTQFFSEMQEKYFLNYNVKVKEFSEKVIKEDAFQKLSLDEQKKMFIAMLDNNQMYVNKSEMADNKYSIGKDDQKLTQEFYNIVKDIKL